jgi:predicted Kef-type K+ transport protein
MEVTSSALVPGVSDFAVALALAAILGFAAQMIRLPPLAGFLAAGFALKALGMPASPLIAEVADLGVILLLFTIGLKLKPSVLARAEVWGGASTHAVVIVAFFSLLFSLIPVAVLAGLGVAGAEAIIIFAFALSFSSTVFAVKVLEERGGAGSLDGRTAIGILIFQDVLAVAFLTASTGKLPSIWAFALVGLVLLRPVLSYLLERAGSGELLPMFGLFAAVVVGATSFSLVGLKPDLGALVLGMMMAGHRRAGDVADALFTLKEVMLVGFFLNIGLIATVSMSHVYLALGLVALVPIKAALFFLVLTAFRLRARSAFLASVTLASYSEFGLIVGAVAVDNGWLAADALTVLALAIAISFVAASVVNMNVNRLYARLSHFLKRFETISRHSADQPLRTGDAQILVFGMGRVGTGAYDYLRAKYGDSVVAGIESNAERVATHRESGRNVYRGDAADSDFWERMEGADFRVVLLAMPDHHINMYALSQIKRSGFGGFIVALAKYSEDAEALKQEGAHRVFNMYAEAGSGFAASVDELIEKSMNDTMTAAPG